MIAAPSDAAVNAKEPRVNAKADWAVLPSARPQAHARGSGGMPNGVTHYNIRLEGIRFRARHGASDAERYLLQDFVVDLEVALPVEQLPESDERSCVYDYEFLATLVVEEGTRTSYKLLETLARRLLDRVLNDTPASGATVRLRKFGPPTTASVDTVAIELSGHV